MTGTRRGVNWAVLVLAALVVVGVFVQLYLIGAYVFGAGRDALDAHKDLGNVVHGVEVLTFLAAIGVHWRRWAGLVAPFLLAAIGTIQVLFAGGDDWVGGFHAPFALLVLILASVVVHRSRRELGLGRRAPGST